jgi:AAA domain
LKRRMKAFAKAIDVNIQHGKFLAYSMPDPWLDLSNSANVLAMIERIKAFEDIGVLVIDHLGQVFGGIDENSALASQIMGAIRQISEACNVAIILIHHAKKGQGKEGGMIEDSLRGSGAILAGVDAAFLVERDQIDKDQVTIKPVAVRGPDAPNISAKFSYEQNENMDLTFARFWRIAYRSIAARARDAIIQALQEKAKLNHTQLRTEAKRIDASLSDANIREGISTLEGTLEIIFIKGDKGSKNYELPGDSDEDEN